MLVSVAKLKKFITKSIVYSRGMTGKRTPYLLDLCLNTCDNKLIIYGVSKDNSIMIDFSTPVESTESETFYVTDAVDFIKVLKDGLKGKVEITNEGISTDTGLIEYPLECSQINSISNFETYYNNINDTGYGNAILNTSVTAKSKDIVDAVKKVNYGYELFEYKFEVENNKFFVSILSRDNKEFKTEIPAVVTGDDCRGIYSIGVDCIFKELGLEIILHLGNNTPMIVEDAGDRVIFFPVEYLDR